MVVTCTYCQRPAVFCETSTHVYGGRDFGMAVDLVVEEVESRA